MTTTDRIDLPTTGGTRRLSSPDGHVWTHDSHHQRAPRSTMGRRSMEQGFNAGFATAFDRLGAPLRGLVGTHVDGWFYQRPVPAGAPDRPGSSVPPAVVLKVVSRLHPELRRRERQARQALQDRLWIHDVEAWWRERPEWERRFADRQQRELARLDDAALAREVAEAADDAGSMSRRHFELVTLTVGVGLVLARAADGGADPAAVAEQLRGASRATSEPVRHLRAIAEAVRGAGGVAAAPTTVEELRAVSPEVDALVTAYLDTYGWRSLDSDVSAATLAEQPDLLARSVASHLVPAAGGTVDEPQPLADDLVDAGRCYEALDDNSAVLTWALGNLRRVVLAAAGRLVAAGRLAEPDHVFALEPDEVAALLVGGPGPTPSEVASRHAAWMAQHDVDPPEHLGGTPAPPPDPSVFPPAMGTVARAVGIYLGLRFPPPRERTDTGQVRVEGRVVATGSGVGVGTATGRAVVARSAADAIARLEPGDVLVCPYTNPAYNALFPLVSAVVTEVGGVLGHTAVTAREVGIPAVVGVGDLSAIADGATVTVQVTGG